MESEFHLVRRSGLRLAFRRPRLFLAHFRLIRGNVRSFWLAVRLALI